MPRTTYGAATESAIRKLEQISYNYEQVSEGSRKTPTSPVRHKVFVSYHAADAIEVLDFIESHTDVFIPRAIGIEEDGSDIINSTDVDYIRQTIRAKYLKDSTVTLVAIGKCTWARRFVDWEIYTSLRNPGRNGLLAVQMPSISGSNPPIPGRLALNRPTDKEEGYAQYWEYPTSSASLRAHIEAAFRARSSKSHLVKLGGDLRKANASC
ncbi:TIR domain-containing protein [Aeromicrobium yanjiei]|uniref:Thoeris protein ThsB TIR-like domain-containing protein n=1 Tax=Aeromicrobium yanjiei TaxID=2662028 RepID=A0A5Q2MDX7_9ACTN|nr:TIR domain-containing protein [Aeromicrobium yanjiei]QGG41307.1 hypothetical protein GEV26_07970 [Aeromicrobium yanjiei]